MRSSHFCALPPPKGKEEATTDPILSSLRDSVVKRLLHEICSFLGLASSQQERKRQPQPSHTFLPDKKVKGQQEIPQFYARPSDSRERNKEVTASLPFHPWRDYEVKGIDRPFGEGVKIRLIRSLLINWRLGNFFFSF